MDAGSLSLSISRTLLRLEKCMHLKAWVQLYSVANIRFGSLIARSGSTSARYPRCRRSGPFARIKRSGSPHRHGHGDDIAVCSVDPDPGVSMSLPGSERDLCASSPIVAWVRLSIRAGVDSLSRKQLSDVAGSNQSSKPAVVPGLEPNTACDY